MPRATLYGLCPALLCAIALTTPARGEGDGGGPCDEGVLAWAASASGASGVEITAVACHPGLVRVGVAGAGCDFEVGKAGGFRRTADGAFAVSPIVNLEWSEAPEPMKRALDTVVAALERDASLFVPRGRPAPRPEPAPTPALPPWAPRLAALLVAVALLCAWRVRRSRRPLAALLFGLLVSWGLAEAAAKRGVLPVPVQRVRGHDLRTATGGEPIWQQEDRTHRACADAHPERIRIAFVGSSITYGSALPAEEAFPALLEQRLTAARPSPGFCVMTFAQPGFQFQQKLAVARDQLQRYRPALLFWEGWVEWLDYAQIGDTAYMLGDLRRRPDGSLGIRGVPDGPNRFLFRRSWLYESLVLRFGERQHVWPTVEDLLRTRYPEVPALAAAMGARLSMYLATPLDRPFVETAASPPEWQASLLAFARARKIPAFRLQDALAGQDHLAIRQDPCCHFNAAGHRALAEIFERVVLAELDAKERRPAR